MITVNCLILNSNINEKSERQIYKRDIQSQKQTDNAMSKRKENEKEEKKTLHKFGKTIKTTQHELHPKTI